MCDEFTASAEEAELARRGLTRREFAAVSAASVMGAAASGVAAAGVALAERMVAIGTPDGTADAFFVHPAKGRHPGILMWPDIAGLRESYEVMARRLASAGYAVLVVNHYYRSARAPIMKSMAEWRTPEGQEKLRPMIAAITPEGTTRDAGACIAWLDAQEQVDKGRRIGTSGYCMGGPYTVRAAAAVPARVGAAASLHGAGLVTDKPDSPHRQIARTQARFLFAIARNDDARAPGDKDALREAAAAAHRLAEVEVYNADHGWCTLDAPSYNHEEAERAWGRMLALFASL